MNERLNVELDDDTMEMIEAISKVKGISVEDFMVKAIVGFIEQNKKPLKTDERRPDRYST